MSWPRYLGQLDPIPDVSFPTFLRIIHDQFGSLLDYQVVRPPSHVRIVQRNHNPADPDALWFPISARDQGTMVESEAILGMLEKFNLTEQDFRDALNKQYKLSATSKKAPQLPKIART